MINKYLVFLFGIMTGMVAMSDHEYKWLVTIIMIVVSGLVANGLAFGEETE